MPAKRRNLAVRWLAEFTHRVGDLYAYQGGLTKASEGVATQRRLQQDRPPSYRTEVAVAFDFDLTCPSEEAQDVRLWRADGAKGKENRRMDGLECRLQGRVDGLDLAATPALVEEFKTTRSAPDLVHRHDGPVHWAQARLYAAMLAAECPEVEDWLLRLLYCHPDTRQAQVFEERQTSASRADFLDRTLARFAELIGPLLTHQARRDAWLREREFPFPSYRPHQRATARRCYQAFAGGESLLLEAPTGSGKTVTLLYAALKSLPTTEAAKLLFLTGRGTGAAAAEAALERLDGGSGQIRRITLAAKEKQCLAKQWLQAKASADGGATLGAHAQPHPGEQRDGRSTPCDAQTCPYAKGYFDKREAALATLLSEAAIRPELVREVGRAYEVCPYELSLDAALEADVVIGDYNYVFDPIVSLQRFADGEDIQLLVDEAHQLSGRAQEMLSVSLRRSTVKAALAEGPPAAVGKRLRALDRALVELRRRHERPAEVRIDPPAALTRAVERFVESLYSDDIRLQRHPAVQAAALAALRWQRGEGWRRDDAFMHLLRSGRREIEVALHCLDPSEHIAEALGRYRSSIRFSGTLSPLPLHNALHGLAEAPAERAGNLFRPDQLAVLLVWDINTYFKSRQKSMRQLVDLTLDISVSQPGHYLLAFPSYDYLNGFAQAAQEHLPPTALHLQGQDMADDERAAFLRAFAAAAPPAFAAVVLGGVFAESVDFAGLPGDQAERMRQLDAAPSGRQGEGEGQGAAGFRLSGVLVVGTGRPPTSLTRASQEAYFDAKSGNGAEVAYLQPAMTKVLQVAGRLLRSPQDRGVLCLIDPRFRHAEQQRFFPAHWRPQPVRGAEVGATVAKFWQGSMLDG